jgi:hypothetical protein
MAKQNQDPDEIKKKALETASIIEDTLRSIADNVASAFEAAMSGMDTVSQSTAKDIQSRFNKMAKVTDDIASNAVKLKQGLVNVDSVNKQILDRQIKQESLGSQLVVLAKQQGVAVKNVNELLDGTVVLTANQKALVEGLVEEYKNATSYNEEYIKQLEEQKKLQEEINDKLGISGKLLKGVSKIPILGNLVDTNKALEAMNAKIAEGGGRMAAMGAGLKSLGKDLSKSFSDPVAIIGTLTKLFSEIVSLGFAADKQTTDLSKSMSISYEQASLVRDRFVEISDQASFSANEGERLFLTTTNLVAAQLELASTFGTTVGFSDQMVKDQVLLTKQIGLTAEEAGGVQQLAMANGMSAKDVTNSIIKQTSALAKQTGIQLDNKKVIGEVAKVSGQLRLQYQNNPALIAQAVVQTQKLGISLEQAAKSSRSLLDFESSISNELEAELLTGKDLNLEKARLLALNGDVAGSTAEMLRQMGSAAEFGKMNVLQQDALAKAVGMNTDELANSLIQQENLNNLGSESKKQIQEKADELRKNGQIDEANKLMNSIGNEEEARAALERQSAQDRFTAAVERIKALIGDIVAGPMGAFLEKISKLLTNVGALKLAFVGISTIIAGIGAIKLAGLIAQLTSALVVSGALSATAAATASAITFGVGAIAVVAGIATIMAAVSSAKSDVTQSVKDGQADSSRGPFQITDKFGATAGTAVGDSIYVSPNIKNGPPPSSGTSGGNVKVENQISAGTTVIQLDGLAMAKAITPYVVEQMRQTSVKVQ